MKKNHKAVIRSVVLITLFFGGHSCSKEIASNCDNLNRVVPVQTHEKSSNNYVLLTYAGHDAKDCSGCILFNGRLIHINCQGWGDACLHSAAVTLNQVASSVTATTTDTFDLTSEDFFLMPDRSLNYTDEKGRRIFLNIPEQMVYRDTTTLQFTFTGLFFSETAAYSNN